MDRMPVFALLILALAAGSASAAEKDPIAIGDVRVQLYYEHSGRLSANIAPPAKFSLWNTGAGEGSAEEPASDILVTVPVRIPPGDTSLFTRLPLTISARNAAGKLLGSRTFPAGMVMVPYAGMTFARLWLNDVQCAGRIGIEAIYGAQKKRALMNFACGE